MLKGPHKIEDRAKITVLLPCKNQKEEFLKDAIESVVAQDSCHWLLDIIISLDTTDRVKEIIGHYLKDPRIRMYVNKTNSFAGALNTGLELSNTEFVSILLSDDRYDKRAISTIHQYIQDYPDVDFFYSSRKYIDAKGNSINDTMLSVDHFTLDDFKIEGSRVKHLLCWRREKSIAIGGFDEEVALHGCDDFDFPWSMAQAGCKFKAIKECLYYYRPHHDFERLTTHVPIEKQIEILRKIFKKHKISKEETENYIKKAFFSYLVEDKVLSFERSIINLSRFRQFSEARRDEFFQKGYKKRHFFPHRVYFIPKSGPDHLKLAQAMCGISEPYKLVELILYSYGTYIEEFPNELFFDKDIIWHEQQLGKTGHVVFVYLAIENGNLFTLNHVSDLVQRISRSKGYKTRIEKKFKGWHYMLLNAVLNFAVENGIKNIFSPTSDLAIANTDHTRAVPVKRELFERVYDRAVSSTFNAEKSGEWWKIDVEKNIPKLITPEKNEEIIKQEKTICVCHDIEAGLGHGSLDQVLLESANENFLKTVDELLSIESEMGIKTTYNVVGCLLDQIRERIENGGHCIAFHSYDHNLEKIKLFDRLSRNPVYYKFLDSFYKRIKGKPYKSSVKQLRQCRVVDFRIKGYRPPQSKVTRELNDKNLCYYNFEWLASSASSLKIKMNLPAIQNGIIKIPILFDDWEMYKHHVPYEVWEKKAIQWIKENHFVAFSLHDCYSQYWLPHYKEFLKKIRGLGTFKVMDAVANEVFLINAK